jgi:transposase-like protein
MSVLDNSFFKDDTAAREHLEAIRWPNGPVCPHCGAIENIKRLEDSPGHRPGLYKCYNCKGHFTVTVGTLFEGSKIPLHKWFLAVYFLCASKKGMSSCQIERMLGVTYKTAWFMTHRIREAMRDSGGFDLMGGNGGTVEVDETFWGNKKPRGQKKGRGWAHKEKILSLVEREGGRVRSYHVERVNAATLAPILREQIAQDARIMTDEASHYTLVGREFAEHGVVSHGIGEYVRGDVHSNTIEGYFSIVKRGLTGTYHHVSKQHLKRYMCEFDFRYNYRKTDDMTRTMEALRGISGKRMMYRDSSMGHRPVG